jgi:hypothetical protein
MIAELKSQTLIVEGRSENSEKVMRKRFMQGDNALNLIRLAVHRSDRIAWLKQPTSFL